MSKICIGVLKNGELISGKIDKELQPLLDACGLGISYGLSYNEPLLRAFSNDEYLILDMYDKSFIGNCEMFLLPDNCAFNGQTNNFPFEERMNCFQKLLAKILEHTVTIELFIGDSGTPFDDFEQLHVHINEFSHLSKCLNSEWPPDLHFTLHAIDS